MTAGTAAQLANRPCVAGIFLLPLLAMSLITAVSRGAETEVILPTAIWSPTPTYPPSPARPFVDNLIDGDLTTSCCFLDDTPTGKNPKTTPPNAAPPITARFVLDLGKPQEVSGLRLVASRSWNNCMAENVSVFACGDREGKVNVRCLRDNAHLPPVHTFHAAFVTWEPVATRYVSVVVNKSYDERRSEFGWWWGCWRYTVGALPKTAGGPLYEFAGSGGDFAVQIAEVSCFCGQPADMPGANPPHAAYPESRLQRDWMYQDCGLENRSMVANAARLVESEKLGPDISRCFSSKTDCAFERAMVERVLAELKRSNVDTAALNRGLTALASVSGSDPRWKELYFTACRLRRQERLKAVRQWASQFVYVKHYVFGGWTQIEPTDELSDEQFYERNPDFHEGSQLCLATIHEDGSIAHEVLLDKPHGIIRDPNLSFDAETLVFSMRDNFKTDDNHLYKMTLADRRVQQITFSPTAAGKTLPCSDTEPCFAPSGEIIFQSTRCGQLDVCWAHPTSNLYVCDINGQHIRRLAFDQVRTLYPQVLNDGRIIYTRWEYNDRNPFFLQSLFAMNADGTAQTAFYGNNSDYPAALIHARAIPGSSKVIAVISGHHVLQKGKLAIIDRSKGSDGNSGIEYVAGASPDGKPGRRPSNIHSPFDRWPYDLFGQVGPQWQYPYAFDETHYLVAFNPEGCHFLKGPFSVPFGVYFMTADGARELLAFDWSNSCGQAIPIAPREKPVVNASQVDWRQKSGRFYVHNVYSGPGVKGVAQGTIKQLRVVALEYRAAKVSENFNDGRAGNSNIQTPVSIGNGSQDVKHVLGDVDVEEDGSVYFEVPARNAVYFQLLDKNGRCVQTMRSWTMVMPGERCSCVGCHEDKQSVPTTQTRVGMALAQPAQTLKPLAGQSHPFLKRLEREGLLESVDSFLGVNQPRSLDAKAPVEGFSYAQMVQPIWDKHCTACHQGNTSDPDEKKRSALRLTGEVVKLPPTREVIGQKDFTQSYLALTSKGKCTPLVNWIHPVERSAMLPPYACGSSQSRLMGYLEPSHYDVRLTDAERRIVACWIDLAVPFCGSYAQANTWNRKETELYEYFQMKRVRFAEEEIANIQALQQGK
ncbi:MAG: hypothetical protein ABFD16_22640 [Thermoguttaceae bacterium]